MTMTLYDLAGAEDERRFSPYCWRARLALAHKGLEADCLPVRFTEKDRIAFSGGQTYPVLADGTCAIVDSWDIACYLEDTYADRPSLFGGDIGRAQARFIAAWVDTVLHPQLVTMVVADIWKHLHEKDRDYFRQSREARFGAPLEEVQKGREERLPALRAALAPLRAVLKHADYLCGAAPAYGDYAVFGSFQWARSISPFRLLEEDDRVYAWRARMLELYDGLAGHALGYAP